MTTYNEEREMHNLTGTYQGLVAVYRKLGEGERAHELAIAALANSQHMVAIAKRIVAKG